MNLAVIFNGVTYLRWYGVKGSLASVGTAKNDLLYFSIALSFGEAVLGVSFLITNWFYAPEFEALVNFYHLHLSCISSRPSIWGTHVSSSEFSVMDAGQVGLCTHMLVTN